ncbi:MAG: lipopolysaccharide biosynthesis protein [Flavisolibacter sp.]|nr:lipopolysaccharide biosynthesis protein [Flavisolibacter sp.]
MYKIIFKNSAIYGILPQLPKIGALFVLPLTTPFLSAVDFGVVGTVSSYTYATSVFNLLGLEAVIQIAFFHYPKQYKWLWRQLYGFITLWSIIYIALLAVLLYNIIPPEAHEQRWEIVFIKVLPLLLFVPSEFFAISYYVLNQKALPVASRSLILGFISLFFNYYFIAHLKMGYMGWFLADMIAGCITGFVFCLPLYTKWKLTPIFNFKWRLIKKSLKIALPLIPHNYSAYMLDSSDRVIMERVGMTTANIGRYSLAYNFGKYVETVTLAAGQAVGPLLLQNIKKKNWRDYEKLVFYFQSLVLFACFTLALWIPQWLPLLVRNNELLDIQTLMVVIILSYSYRPIFNGCNQIAYYYEKSNVLWRITFVAGIINIILNLIFIPIYGLAAAAISTFLAFMFVAFAGFTFKFYKDVKDLNLKPLFWLLMICASLGAALILLNVHFYWKIASNIFMLLLLFFISDRTYEKGSLVNKIKLFFIKNYFSKNKK